VNEETIRRALLEGAELRKRLSEDWPAKIEMAARWITEAIQAGGKVLACGNGGSAADALHFASELVNRFESERKALPAIALGADAPLLTSIANDDCFAHVFSRQVEAFGRRGDVLVAISTSGHSPNVLAAVDCAARIGMRIVALTGKDGGRLAQHEAVGVLLHVPHPSTARVQEMHIAALHLICACLDASFQKGACNAA